MAKLTIIGHRGARGIALENTLPSFAKAIEVGARMLEFDVHATRDGQFVVCHDDDLAAVSDSAAVIAETSWADLQQIRLRNGAVVPLLREVLDLARTHHVAVIVEVKIRTHLPELCALLDQYSDLDMTVASFLHDAIEQIHALRPAYRVYLAEDHHPLRALRHAKLIGAQGLDLKYLLLNPIIFWLARRWQLEIMVYTINLRLVAALFRLFYPGVAICTDHPERFVSPPDTANNLANKAEGAPADKNVDSVGPNDTKAGSA